MLSMIYLRPYFFVNFVVDKRQSLSLLKFFYFSIPEIPCLADVPYLSVDNFHPDLESKLHELLENEGRVLERAPAQISEIQERPGSVLITWAEVRMTLNNFMSEI